MANFNRLAMAAIEWGLVPAILLLLLWIGVMLEPNDPKLRSSTTAGKVAGFILFVLYVIGQKGHTMGVFVLPEYGVLWGPLVVSTSVLFILKRVIDALLKTRLAGFVAMLLIAASLMTMHSYVFLAPYRATIVFVALGGTLGVLLETLFFERDAVALTHEK